MLLDSLLAGILKVANPGRVKYFPKALIGCTSKRRNREDCKHGLFSGEIVLTELINAYYGIHGCSMGHYKSF